jgi:ligand-binding sensor domain-containing protein
MQNDKFEQQKLDACHPLENAIPAKNTDSIRAKIFCELANGSTIPITWLGLRTMTIYLVTLLIVISISACKDEPPVIPGLTKSKVDLFTDPDTALIYFNNVIKGNITPLTVNDLEPGFYKIDLKRINYLDTTIYYLLLRNVEDSIFVELRENPKYWWKNYSTQNSNLSTNSLLKIRIDKFDNKWIATNLYGLLKFDGNTFSVYNISNSGIPSNSINDILIKDNILWVGTTLGIGRFDGSNWKVYNSSNSQIPDQNITSLVIDHDNNLWAGTNSGLLKFDGVSFQLFNRSNSGISSDLISSLAVDNNDILWIGTWGSGICSFQNFIWKVYSSYNSQLQDNYISSIILDNSGILWVGSGSMSIFDKNFGGLSYFTGSSWLNFNRFNSMFPGTLATDLIQDKFNNIWISTDAGLAKFDRKKWRVYNTSNSGLKAPNVASVSIDADQNKWCTSLGLSEYIGGK